MEFLIGREVTGSNAIKVPNEYSSVSRTHAKITIDEDKIVLEDLNSSNGTYVNGRGVVNTTINTNDKITLGKETEYIVNLNEIIDNYNKFINENKTDYTKEFDQLKVIYDKYHENKSSIENKPKKIIAIVVVLFILINVYLHLYYKQIATITSSLTILVSTIGFLLNPQKKIKEKLSDLKIEYKEKYVCPKCRNKFNLETAWKEYKSDIKCPHKCGAIYSK